MYNYKFPMAAITADVVLLCKHEGEIYFMGITRGDEPYKSCIAFPGGFVNVENELIVHAAMRELNEETSLVAQNLRFVGYYDGVNRDPRSRVITFAYMDVVYYEFIEYAVAADDAVEVHWYKANDAFDGSISLAFDHLKILRDAIKMADFG